MFEWGEDVLLQGKAEDEGDERSHLLHMPFGDSERIPNIEVGNKQLLKGVVEWNWKEWYVVDN